MRPNKPVDEDDSAAAAAERVPFPPRALQACSRRRRRRDARFCTLVAWGGATDDRGRRQTKDSFIAHRTEQHARAVATEGAPYPKHSERAEGSPKAGRRPSACEARSARKARNDEGQARGSISPPLSFFFFNLKKCEEGETSL